MKNIDIKSLIIGALLTSTIFLGVAATGTTDKWDSDQQWSVAEKSQFESTVGWEPIGPIRVIGSGLLSKQVILYRKRIK